ncbi:MAG TPA: LysR family transcriptional regulator [Steroidobacteraceae bacterium]|nr:LysR family transcriptional regulator [Steroidobacteraceae bacterium]
MDFGPRCSIGIGKVELLEGIARTGSLSQAARQMRMSYRRAWLLLADLNTSFDEPVARTTTGGSGGGGAVLTPFGKRLVESYRRLESGLRPLTKRCMAGAASRVIAHRAATGVHPASIRRKPKSD